jgi:hypothetical protein
MGKNNEMNSQPRGLPPRGYGRQHFITIHIRPVRKDFRDEPQP